MERVTQVTFYIVTVLPGCSELFLGWCNIYIINSSIKVVFNYEWIPYVILNQNSPYVFRYSLHPLVSTCSRVFVSGVNRPVKHSPLVECPRDTRSAWNPPSLSKPLRFSHKLHI